MRGRGWLGGVWGWIGNFWLRLLLRKMIWLGCRMGLSIIFIRKNFNFGFWGFGVGFEGVLGGFWNKILAMKI
jgi:hypothetical protein